MTDAGLLIAAGAGRRMGRPKALVRDELGSWLVRATQTLGGCDTVTVVLGAAGEDALALLASCDVDTVIAADWASGMGASLAAGMRRLLEGTATRAVVHLVDLPDVGEEVVSRVRAEQAGTGALARATFEGRPGHPVLIGRDHWAAILAGCAGDRGAREYLAAHDVAAVECGDLATGHDVDGPSNPGPTDRA